jgi:hypothetical protein
LAVAKAETLTIAPKATATRPFFTIFFISCLLGRMVGIYAKELGSGFVIFYRAATALTNT